MKKNNPFKATILVIILGVFFISCISNVEEQLIDTIGEEEQVEETFVSYSANVKPIIDGRCISCHSPSGGTSPDLTGYANLKAKAARVKSRVGNGTMPQNGALPQSQIDIVVNWVNEGALDN